MSYDHGRFVWFSLVADDCAKVVPYYAELLGWSISEMDMGEGKTTQIASAGGIPLCAFHKSYHKALKEGPIPHWVAYVSVSDVDATVASFVAHGGCSLSDPYNIPGIGRMQAVADPQGAALYLFKGEGEDGPQSTGLGSCHWNELWAADETTAADFYCNTFGYSKSILQMPMGAYCIMKNNERPRCGIMKRVVDSIVPKWVQYFIVEECDKSVDHAIRLGGTQLAETMDLEDVGRFAVLKDPIGAVSCIIQPYT